MSARSEATEHVAFVVALQIVDDAEGKRKRYTLRNEVDLSSRQGHWLPNETLERYPSA